MQKSHSHEFVYAICTVVVGLCWFAGGATALDASAAQSHPIKIAVFPFELEDFSAASQQGSAPSETTALAQSTEEAKQQLLQSGRYVVVDAAEADISTAKGEGLRNCRGCEAAIAMKLEADQALLGVVTKISMTEYTVRFQISDVRKNSVMSNITTDLRIGADYSWSRGVRWLMKNRVLAPK
jgi:hypothetical protein